METGHTPNLPELKLDFKLSMTFKVIAALLILVGIGAAAYGFSHDAQRTWANYLLSNYYFFSIAMGGTFFFVIQYISQAGWSSGFKRVPEAMMSWFPFAAVFFLLIYFGAHSIYHWSHAEAVAEDALIHHKSPFLNIPFFFARMIVFFTLWIIFSRLLRKFSLKEDEEGGLKWFEKSEFYSKVFIFILALTFSFSAIDWILSIDVHWYSTLFALKNMVSAFLHGASIVILIILILKAKGYFPFINKFHLHDFSRYLFMLAIVYGYFWFSQFMIIWYGNIPEETIYFATRWKTGWETLFFLDIILNWAVPFFVLLPIKASRNRIVILVVILFLIIGQYIDLYQQIMPGTTGKLALGFIEAGMILGFAGLFALVVGTALSKAKIVPVNHPYLDESLDHHFQ
ncbi:MAG: quinol:cytochrome C oxidoreductase [Bacteroidales bacterium]|nr:quinol:cytochrome C oxidoreductase [Bacteroidales bacterium]